VYLSCAKISTIAIRTLEPRHLGVLSGASKSITKLMVCLAQTMHLSCTDTNTTSKWTETRFDMTHVTRSSIRQWYVQRKPCTYFASRLALSPNRSKRLSVEPHHLGVPSGVSKMIYEPKVYWAQTVHLSCTKTNTVSKWTKMRFHMTHIT
jgi:hypothetical protein